MKQYFRNRATSLKRRINLRFINRRFILRLRYLSDEVANCLNIIMERTGSAVGRLHERGKAGGHEPALSVPPHFNVQGKTSFLNDTFRAFKE